jgi:hypothetical protein
MKIGDKVIFVSASDEQVNWGSNDDPRKLLDYETEYEIENIEVHSWHTKFYLKGIKGKFNSVHFEKVKPPFIAE